MTESRQQRRARERTEQKSANRPGTNLRTVPEPEPEGEKPQAIIDIEVSWHYERREPDASHWTIHWAGRDLDKEDSGVGHDLQVLVWQTEGDIHEDYPGYELTFVWELDAEVEAEIDAKGITLPVS
ncbi:hypothetical protein AB0C34_28115 [Nocardia sp. NPDC049220]|uniref:hypothetical protein n=1 Tax=Nocardia sp. NPDC049220 TaxID=3155273 RepID=UPI0033E408FB